MRASSLAPVERLADHQNRRLDREQLTRHRLHLVKGDGAEQVEFRIRWSANVADLSQRDRIVYPALADESPEDEPDNRNIYNILAIHEVGRREGLLIVTQRRSDATT